MAGIQTGWGSQWETLATAITDYYGGGIESAQYQKVVQMLDSGEYTMEEMESILGNIPEFNRTYNASGELTGVSYGVTKSTASAANEVAQQVNSNAANATQSQFNTVQTITKDAQTGKVAVSDTLVKYKTGQLAPTTTKSIAGSAVGAVLAASAGITVGKTLDSVLYNFNPDFWDDIGMSSLNPETWGEITAGDNSLGAKLFNMVFDIDPTTGNPQPYMDEKTFAYMVAYMISQGVFDGKTHGTVEEYVYSEYPNISAPFTFSVTSLIDIEYTYMGSEVIYAYSQPVCVYANEYNHSVWWVAASKTDFLWGGVKGGGRIPTPEHPAIHKIINGKDVYYIPTEEYVYEITSSSGVEIHHENAAYVVNDTEILAYNMLYGGEIYEGVEGIDDQDGATQFDASGISDPSNIAAVLLALQTQFPELWENRIEVSPDGDTILKYIPVGFPTGGTGTQPTTHGATQADTAPDISGDGDNAPDELIKTLIDMLQNPLTQNGMESDTTTPTKPIDPNGDPRGTGENPPIVPPVGSASALWKIYNPSQSQLDTFGAWLWSSDFVDQLLKLFNDPMQAIIGLHKVYCNPPVSGSGPIKVGYLVSNASANYVSNQYTEIDCGDVDMKEHFGNVFDYDGFTRVSVYLPFIGFRDLDIKDVMRGKMNIKYGIDVLTGACLAKITITRDLNSPILYTFEGNCAVQYPVSSGSYMGIVASLASVVGNIAGTIATGGAIAPLTITGSVSALMNAHTKVERSGNVSSNVGALGPKKPYVVIQRPQTQMPQNGILIEGKGQNERVSLGTLTGYVKVKKADLMGIPATGNELNEIRDLLEAGIYMN